MSNDKFQDWMARIAGFVIAALIASAVVSFVIGVFVADDDGPASPPAEWNGR